MSKYLYKNSLHIVICDRVIIATISLYITERQQLLEVFQLNLKKNLPSAVKVIHTFFSIRLFLEI